MGSHIGTEQFPICFESQDVVVYTNPSGEVFVQSKRYPRAKLRITPGGGLDISAFGGNPFVIRQIGIAG
jgi:hypothetical protein